MRHRCEHGYTLGAQTAGIGRILDIVAHHNLAIGQTHRRTHMEFGIRGVGISRRLVRTAHQFGIHFRKFLHRIVHLVGANKLFFPHSVSFNCRKDSDFPVTSKVFGKTYSDFGAANSKNASKNANSDAPAWVSKVSSGNIERSNMQRKTKYK